MKEIEVAKDAYVRGYKRKSPSERFWPKVDKISSDKGCWLWLGAKHPSGYGMFWYLDILSYAHRVSWCWANYCPMPPPRFVVDHKCHNKSCVNPEHLRLVAFKQNVENRTRPQTNNVSGYTGASWSTKRNKWLATVTSGGKLYYLGYFKDVHEAGEAARQGRLKYHTHNDKDRQQDERD